MDFLLIVKGARFPLSSRTILYGKFHFQQDSYPQNSCIIHGTQVLIRDDCNVLLLANFGKMPSPLAVSLYKISRNANEFTFSWGLHWKLIPAGRFFLSSKFKQISAQRCSRIALNWFLAQKFRILSMAWNARPWQHLWAVSNPVQFIPEGKTIWPCSNYDGKILGKFGAGTSSTWTFQAYKTPFYRAWHVQYCQLSTIAGS